MTKSPPIYRRFSKPSSDFLRHKGSLFTNNDARLKEQKAYEKIYRRAAPRTKCKICEARLKPDVELFHLGSIGFCRCAECGHLNGLPDDDAAFHRELYVDNSGRNYAKAYDAESVKDWIARRDDIYVPKIDFLFESLVRLRLDPKKLTYADLGAGSGYLVGALFHRGIEKASGYDVSPAQVELGNRMLGRTALRTVSQEGIYAKASHLKSDVISLIGVLEHLRLPNRLLQAISSNRSIKFVYMSLPMVSFSVLVEGVFPAIARRHLTGGHTHLFTEGSLYYLEHRYCLRRISEWRFGSDISDLFRSLLVTFQSDRKKAGLAEMAMRELLPLIDRFQNVLDQAQFCSELHAVWQVER